MPNFHGFQKRFTTKSDYKKYEKIQENWNKSKQRKPRQERIIEWEKKDRKNKTKTRKKYLFRDKEKKENVLETFTIGSLKNFKKGEHKIMNKEREKEVKGKRNDKN